MASPERAAAQAGPQDGAADIMSFCAREISGFFGYLSGAVAAYGETKQLPEGKYKTKPGPKTKRASDKPKAHRQPTAYNVFVQRKAAELKALGVEHDGSKGTPPSSLPVAQLGFGPPTCSLG